MIKMELQIEIVGRLHIWKRNAFDVYRKTYGVWAKQDPLCDTSFNYPNYRIDDIKIHHCRFKNIGQDCIYAGNTDPLGIGNIFVPQIQVGIISFQCGCRM
jgi:hypothetical protein